MKLLRPTNLSLAALTAFGAWRVFAVLPGLPEYLATNFDGDGAAQGWMSHSRFAWVTFAMWALLVVSFWSTRFLLDRRAAQSPAADRFASPATRDRFASGIEMLGVATLAVCLAVLEMLYAANAMAVPRLAAEGFLPVLGLYVLGVAGGALWLRRTVTRSP